MKQLNETFTDDEFATLADIKGDRTWHDAILEEFDASND